MNKLFQKVLLIFVMPLACFSIFCRFMNFFFFFCSFQSNFFFALFRAHCRVR